VLAASEGCAGEGYEKERSKGNGGGEQGFKMMVRLFGKLGAEVPDLLFEVAKGDYFLENSQAKLECIRKRMEFLAG